jgi:hypothetical protein
VSKVYAVQSPTRRDRRTGQQVQMFDFSDAERFGELVIVLDAEIKPTAQVVVERALWAALGDFTQDDYLLLTGNPIIMSLASAVALDLTGGHCKFLQWSGEKKAYEVIEYRDFWGPEDESQDSGD